MADSPGLRTAQYIFRISTGASELDELLGGGFDAQSMTEMHGEFRTGKTQVCHTLAITTQIPSEATNHTGGKVIYIDTEGTFRPERMRKIAEKHNLDFDAAMENIFCVQALNSEHQAHLLHMVPALCEEHEGWIKLLIVDSVMALYRVDYSGRGELAARQQALGQFLKMLHKLAMTYNFAVVMTNQMTSDPGASMSFVSDPKKAIGGHVLAHAVQTRLLFKKGAGDDRIARLVDSPDRPGGDATFTITEAGVADAK